MKNHVKKLMALLLAVLMVLPLIACHSNEETYKEGDKLSFTYLRPVWGAATYTPDGPYEKALEEAANVNIDVQIVPVTEYDAKAKLVISTKNFRDIIWALGPVDASWREIEDQGAFYPIEELLESHPAVKATVSDDIWEMMRNEDGHIYFLPNTTSSEIPFFMYYRKDWFDELGIEEPTTIGELEAALETIQTAKPDVIPMTVGLGASRWMFKDVGTAFGAVMNSWQPSPEDPNTLIPSFMTEGQKDYIFWLQDMYHRGLLDPDTDLNPDTSHGKNKFMTSRAACYPGGYPDMLELYAALQESDPDAEIGIMGPFTGPTGIQGGLRVNFPVDRGMYFNAKLSAEKIKAIFDFLEWTLTDGFNLCYYGIEGKMCIKNEDGSYSKIPNAMREDAYKSTQIEPLGFLNHQDYLVDFKDYQSQFEMLGIGDKYQYWYDEFQDYCSVKYYDYLVPTVKSETNIRIGAQLEENYLNATMASVILDHNVTREFYDRAANAWLKAGGQDIMNEFNAAQKDKSKPNY